MSWAFGKRPASLQSYNFLPRTCPSVLSPGSLQDSKIKSVTQNREPRAFLSKRTKGVGVGEAVRQTNDKCRQRVSCEVSHSLPERVHTHARHTRTQSSTHTHHPSRHTLEEEVKPVHQSKRDCIRRALIFQTESLQAPFPPSDESIPPQAFAVRQEEPELSTLTAQGRKPRPPRMRPPQGHLGNYCCGREEARLGRGHFTKAGGERTWHTGSEGTPRLPGLGQGVCYSCGRQGAGWGKAGEPAITPPGIRVIPGLGPSTPSSLLTACRLAQTRCFQG